MVERKSPAAVERHGAERLSQNSEAEEVARPNES
jgi:hypothetical protein